jgi:very-short-patch-repair endonuclease
VTRVTPLDAPTGHVDGGVHGSSRSADRRRDETLRGLGYRVVRVEAALVVRDTAAVLAVIRAALT